MDLLKEGNTKHKGIFFYMNRNKKMGRTPLKLSPDKFRKILMAIKKGKVRARK